MAICQQSALLRTVPVKLVELEEVASSYLACEASALLLSYNPRKQQVNGRYAFLAVSRTQRAAKTCQEEKDLNLPRVNGNHHYWWLQCQSAMSSKIGGASGTSTHDLPLARRTL